MVNAANIIWLPDAMKQLEEIHKYIQKDSFANADKIRKKIFDSTRKLIKNPESCRPDKYKIDNDGTIRAYEIYHYRIVYQIINNNIFIFRVSHTSREPKEY